MKLTDNEIISLLYTSFAKIEALKKEIEKLEIEAEKRGLL